MRDLAVVCVIEWIYVLGGKCIYYVVVLCVFWWLYTFYGKCMLQRLYVW